MFYKKVLSTVMALILLINVSTTVNAEDSATSGTCGENVTWSFDNSTGELTISGTGNMTNFSSELDAPWQSYRNSIKSVSIENGVASIGRSAFLDCIVLTSIDIPNSVIKMEGGAFYNCTSLTSITIPPSVTFFGPMTFGNCIALTSITIPPSVTVFGPSTFKNCIGLTTIKILSCGVSLYSSVFIGCESLTSIIICSVPKIPRTLFSSCKSLKSVTYMDKSEPSCSNMTLSHCYDLKAVNVPRGYKNSTFCGMPIRRIPATHNFKPDLYKLKVFTLI